MKYLNALCSIRSNSPVFIKRVDVRKEVSFQMAPRERILGEPSIHPVVDHQTIQRPQVANRLMSWTKRPSEKDVVDSPLSVSRRGFSFGGLEL
jgi:hypothetical protein